MAYTDVLFYESIGASAVWILASLSSPRREGAIRTAAFGAWLVAVANMWIFGLFYSTPWWRSL